MNTNGIHIVVTGGNTGGNLRPSFRNPQVPPSVLPGRPYAASRFTVTASWSAVSA